MSLDSPRYDASLAAALAVYRELYPDAVEPDALIVSRLTFLILHAIEAAGRRTHADTMPPAH